jgi:Flp pilus assembly pilin Flp
MGHDASQPAASRPADLAGRRAASGQGLVEYILILSLIAIVALVALSFFGTQLSDLLSVIASQINP